MASSFYFNLKLNLPLLGVRKMPSTEFVEGICPKRQEIIS